VPCAESIPDEQVATAERELLAAERSAALREAFLHLPLSCQRLITTLIEDPPVPYAQVSAKLGIPVASIGPARGRCLDELRRHPAIAALINAEAETARCSAGPWPSSPEMLNAVYSRGTSVPPRGQDAGLAIHRAHATRTLRSRINRPPAASGFVWTARASGELVRPFRAMPWHSR
jgi:hypothetical protein